MKKVVITGITGFIGSYLAKKLEIDGYDVYGLSNSAVGKNIYKCSLSDAAGLVEIIGAINPDIVIHCAAISSVVHEDAAEYYLTNVIGTKNILKATNTLRRKVRFIFMSTAGVYGNHSVEELSEDLAPLPVHDYGMSKFCAEQWVHVYKDNLDFTILRPFSIVGVGMSMNFVVPKIAHAFAAQQKTIELGNVDVFRDYLDISTFCDIASEVIMNERFYSETVNLCSGMPTSLKQLISHFQEKAGYEIEVIFNQKFYRKNEIWRLIGSAQKLEKLLEHKLPEPKLKSTLFDMYEYYKNLNNDQIQQK
jgi:nucleoside-diphosphate-sugar epimerase